MTAIQAARADRRIPTNAASAVHLGSTGNTIKPAFRSIRDTMAVLGFKSPTSIYELAKEGLLDMRKVMGKSLITQTSIDRLVADAPRVSASHKQSTA
jgi:hypothetical protein